MDTVELRWNKGVLEYRCLLIHERDTYEGNEPSGSELFVDWKKRYSDWKPVPQAE
jgi:hypothetical protein